MIRLHPGAVKHVQWRWKDRPDKRTITGYQVFYFAFGCRWNYVLHHRLHSRSWTVSVPIIREIPTLRAKAIIFLLLLRKIKKVRSLYACNINIKTKNEQARTHSEHYQIAMPSHYKRHTGEYPLDPARIRIVGLSSVKTSEINTKFQLSESPYAGNDPMRRPTEIGNLDWRIDGYSRDQLSAWTSISDHSNSFSFQFCTRVSKTRIP